MSIQKRENAKARQVERLRQTNEAIGKKLAEIGFVHSMPYNYFRSSSKLKKKKWKFKGKKTQKFRTAPLYEGGNGPYFVQHQVDLTKVLAYYQQVNEPRWTERFKQVKQYLELMAIYVNPEKTEIYARVDPFESEIVLQPLPQEERNIPNEKDWIVQMLNKINDKKWVEQIEQIKLLLAFDVKQARREMEELIKQMITQNSETVTMVEKDLYQRIYPWMVSVHKQHFSKKQAGGRKNVYATR